MQEDKEDFPEPEEDPLDFSSAPAGCHCPYCSEVIAAEEMEGFLSPEGNTLVCPNCRKKINIEDLSGGI
ncbi:MAG: hypothetical protein V1727_06030 [Candidatus Omnitrophota bacterium]